jgi:transcriptional regulator with XRE-family HTH domain
VNINSSLTKQLQDKDYRDAYVQSQIRTVLPFQLRSLRASKGLSQEIVAARASMAQPRISDLEKPTGRMPNLDTLCRIAAAYDVALEVRFVPFSELMRNSEGFSPDSFTIPTFDEELEKEAELEKARKQAEERERAEIQTAATRIRKSRTYTNQRVRRWNGRSDPIRYFIFKPTSVQQRVVNYER